MEQVLEYQYPIKIKVPRGLKTTIESFSRAVVQRQPESVPHFATLYFAELMRFRAAHTNEEIQGLVKKFHESRVSRLPNRGLGTMKNVTARKPPVVANAALFIIRTQKMQQTSGSITVKSADDNKTHNQKTVPEPTGAHVVHSSQNVKSKTSNLKMAGVTMHHRSTKDRIKQGMALTKKAAASGRSEQKPRQSAKPAPQKNKVECKLVKPAVPTEEPEVENLDVCVSASGPQDDTPILDSPQVPMAEEGSGTHLASSHVLIELEATHSRLVYPPLPDEQVVYSAEQQITQDPQPQQYIEAILPEAESDGEDLLELESDLSSDHSSAMLTSGRKNQSDNKLVRPIAPAEDPEWVPPKMEEVVVAELMNQQLSRLLSAKRKVANSVKQKTSTSTQQILNSHSAVDKDSQKTNKSCDSKLSQTPLSQKETQASFSQKDVQGGTTEAPQIATSQGTQQTVYWALCLMSPVQFIPPPVSDSAASSETTEAPTTGPQPLGAVLQLPQNAMHTYTGTGQSSSDAVMPAMVLPFLSPETWGLCPVTLLHSAGAPVVQCGAASPSEPCQETQNTQQASSQTKEPVPTNQVFHVSSDAHCELTPSDSPVQSSASDHGMPANIPQKEC
ncbi:hypothetical protein ACEWY4_014945 [Coilia grayii]|uniref:RIIa domain-containing protein n=1 Tax=Coilia grayii TaxID=363190 RepID=A0ABD1JTT8_9TELE